MVSNNLNKLKNQFKDRSDLKFIFDLHDSFDRVTVYLVGGAVRDYLLEKEVTDLDFLVEGIGKEELGDFLNRKGYVKDIKSRTFGVFIFRPRQGAENFDIALPRSDHWTGEGYKDLEVDIGVSIKKDLSRRDFTVNAMAVNLRDYQLIDPFLGQEDLEKKVLRSVGDPNKRFMEDPSRILRGVRFSVQLGFEVEKETEKAMESKVSEIVAKLDNGKARVSSETIASEFLKAFDTNTVGTVKRYDKLGILKLILPEVERMKGVAQPDEYHYEGDVFTHTMIALEELEKIKESKDNLAIPKLAKVGMLDEEFSIELKLAILFHDLGKPATFTPPSEEKDRISFNEHDDVGGNMAKKVIDRLKLTIFDKGSRLHVDDDQVAWLVRKHMILVVAKPKEMRLSTLEKYFFHPSSRGQKLMTLSYCDISATIPPSGKPDYQLLCKFLDQIEAVEERVRLKQKEDQLPPPLLDGNEIIKILGIKPGPKVGQLKDKLRDLELAGKISSKKEAIDWLKNNQG